MIGVLAASTLLLGPLAMFNLYFMPYWVGVIWLDIVTYLHHHGTEDPEEQIPWYRGEVKDLSSTLGQFFSKTLSCIMLSSYHCEEESKVLLSIG